MRYLTFEITAEDPAAANRAAAELSSEMTPYRRSNVVVDGAAIVVTVGFDDTSKTSVVAEYAAMKIRRGLGRVGGGDWPVTRRATPEW